MIDKAGEIDRAQQAGTVRGQRLLAAIVGEKPVRIEGVDARDVHIEDILNAIRLDRLDPRNVALPVEGAPTAGDRSLQAGVLVAISKAHQTLKLNEALTSNDQLVLSSGSIRAARLKVIPRAPGTRGRPLHAQLGGDAKTQQHSLRGLQPRAVGLDEPHAKAALLGPLHEAAGIEDAAQEAAAEVA